MASIVTDGALVGVHYDKNDVRTSVREAASSVPSLSSQWKDEECMRQWVSFCVWRWCFEFFSLL